MLEPVHAMLAARRDDVLATMIERLHEKKSTLARLPAPALRQTLGAIFDGFLADFLTDRADHMNEITRPTIEQRARDGTGFGAVFGTTAVTDAVTIGFVFDHIEDPAVQRAAVIRLFEMTAQVSAGMSEIYAAERDRIEAEQQARIAELSTPVVPLYEGILVLPLVGEIDSDRAGHIMESLLEEISREQADVVIIDITGVPVVDTGVANYLVQTAKAVKLLGSTVVLVGIGAEIAQTLVQLGVDLSNITTRANLQSGIEFAFGELGLEIHERH